MLSEPRKKRKKNLAFLKIFFFNFFFKLNCCLPVVCLNSSGQFEFSVHVMSCMCN